MNTETQPRFLTNTMNKLRASKKPKFKKATKWDPMYGTWCTPGTMFFKSRHTGKVECKRIARNTRLSPAANKYFFGEV